MCFSLKCLVGGFGVRSLEGEGSDTVNVVEWDGGREAESVASNNGSGVGVFGK